MSVDVSDKYGFGVSRLAAGLSVLMITQKGVAKRAIPDWLKGEPEYIRTTFLALIVEVVELVQLFNWKQWKDPHVFDEHHLDRMANEFADMLAFLGYIILFLDDLGVSPADLAEAYEEKTIINHARLAGDIEGYGVNKTKEI